MMPKQKTKAMTGREADVKTKDEPAAPPRRLLCVRDSDMPGIGQFHHGQVITDAALIDRIKENPNFQTVKED